MRHWIFIIMVFLPFSCAEYVEKPERLIPEDKMAEILADLAISDQAFIVNTGANIEIGTRHVMQQHKVTATDFSESYKYYSISKKIENILEDAQDIVKDKHPEAAKYIENAAKRNVQTLPNMQ